MVGSSNHFTPPPGLKRRGGDIEEGSDFDEEERKTETWEITAATQAQTEMNSEKESAAVGTAGAGRRKLFLVANKGDPKTTSSTKDATEVQEAVRPNSRHALGRAWPLQLYLYRPYGQEGKRKKKDTREKQTKGKKTDSEREAAKREN
ncbi:hypothetical protein NDU88_002858 [Pleurodeles waltl]|uniref:Uncharacterized protein n=1 Tax=Pleurodeles waltl TaxID=8319 RepID=A0AAV7LLB9_PLEWA|nr:hypothetical protein NDU88_002858 [Pleurodeles waltl]